MFIVILNLYFTILSIFAMLSNTLSNCQCLSPSRSAKADHDIGEILFRALRPVLYSKTTMTTCDGPKLESLRGPPFIGAINLVRTSCQKASHPAKKQTQQETIKTKEHQRHHRRRTRSSICPSPQLASIPVVEVRKTIEELIIISNNMSMVLRNTIGGGNSEGPSKRRSSVAHSIHQG